MAQQLAVSRRRAGGSGDAGACGLGMASFCHWYAAIMGEYCCGFIDGGNRLCHLDDLCIIENRGALASPADANLLFNVCCGWWSFGDIMASGLFGSGSKRCF